MESIKKRLAEKLSFSLVILLSLSLTACSTMTRNPKEASKQKSETTLLKERLQKAQMKIKELESKIAKLEGESENTSSVSFTAPQNNKEYASALGKVNAWMEEGLFSEASSYLEKLIQTPSSQALSSRAHYFLGLSYLRINQIEKAQKQFEKILEKHPSSGVAAHSLHFLSKIHQSKNNTQLATSYENLLKEIYPGSPEMNAIQEQRSFVLKEDAEDSL